MTDKKFALKMVIDGKERDITFEELALSNNLAQEALVGLLIDKKIIKAEDFLNKMQEVNKQRYRSVEDLNKEN